jgi:molybdenum cofactor cytidylyltransferase
MSEQSDHGVAVVVLAAGGSTRVGHPKQLLTFAGTTLLRRAAMTALESSCRPVCVVLGGEAERLEGELADLPVVVTRNAGWETGMASSIRAGVEAVLQENPRADAVVLMLCDQPLVTPALLDALAHEWRTTGRSLVATDYGGEPGVPALFARAWFGDLVRLTGDVGARTILRAHPTEVGLVPFPDAGIDVDSPDDYAALRTSLRP